MAEQTNYRILQGIRVLDLTSVILGTYATQILGDLGADVVKIEQPGVQGGDIMRWGGRSPEGGAPGMGPLYMSYNRNKRSVCLDLKKTEDRATLLKLVAKADVFASNIRMEALERLGLSYEAVKAVRPDIIYVHAAGFGSDGPYAGLAAYDELIQGASGIADLWPRTYGTAEPRYMPTLIADKATGLFMVQAVLAALLHKERGGEGQFVEVPMFECMTHFNMSENLYGHIFDPPTGQYGYNRIINPGRRPLRTKDDWICVAPYSDDNWRQLFAQVGREADIAEDPRFNNYRARIAHIDALYALLEEVMLEKTTAAWLEVLNRLSVPAIRLNRLDTIMDDPHLAATGFFERRPHPSEGTVVDMKHPVRYAAASTETRHLAPRLGEHTDEVLREWGVERP